MAAPGPTGPVRTSATVLPPATDNASTPSSLPQTKTVLQSPQLSTVVNSQLHSSEKGQQLYRITVALSRGAESERLTLITPQRYATGAQLSLQINPRGQLEIQNTPALKQQLLQQHLHSVNRLPAPPPSTAELTTPLTQLIHHLHHRLSNTNLVTTGATRQKVQAQHADLQRLQLQQLQTLTQLLAQLKSTQLPLEKLDGQQIRQAIVRSGLFLEHKLATASTSQSADGKTPVGNAGQLTDIKGLLLRLTQQLTSVQHTLNAGNPLSKGTATTNHTIATQTGIQAGTQLATPLGSGQQTGSGSFVPYTAQLTNLLRSAATMPTLDATTQAQQNLSQVVGLSVLLNFWQKLSPTNPSNQVAHQAAQTANGWSTLFALLFAGPKRIPRLKAPGAHPQGQTPAALLTGLLQSLNAQVTVLQTKQLWLLNQKELNSEFKTLVALELPIQLPNSIQQTVLRIQEKTQPETSPTGTAEKVWKIQLGFDLNDLGLVKALGIYSQGNLNLTFQTQTQQARSSIAKQLPDLTTPLSAWGIAVNKVTYAEYEAEDAEPEAVSSILQQIVNIEL